MISSLRMHAHYAPRAMEAHYAPGMYKASQSEHMSQMARMNGSSILQMTNVTEIHNGHWLPWPTAGKETVSSLDVS